MDTFIFTLGLFVFWWLIGYATLAIFPARLRIIQSSLISPAVGIAVMLLPVFLINRLGIPVKNFGQFLLLGLLFFSVLVILIKRPLFPSRKLLPMITVIIAGLALSAWPMFLYHFDWASYANDDMANYCLGAQRFLENGYFDLPNLNDLNTGQNYSLAYWFMHAAGGMRSGSELTLAVFWAATGLNAHQLFMSVILALHLSLICSTGALVAGNKFPKKAPFVTMFLMAISPLTTLGVQYQLIGQVGGLALLCSSIVLFYRGMPARPLCRLIVSNIAGGLSFSALLIWYPEVLPFLGLGWIIYVGLTARQDVTNAKLIVIPSLLIGILALLMIGPFLFTAIQTLLLQSSGVIEPTKVNSDGILLFPFFFQPTGIPALLGLIPIVGDRHEPLTSIFIAVGIFVFIWILKQIINQLRIPSAPAIISILMLLLSGVLFYQVFDFGLYKLSMYLQPFLWAVIATRLTQSQFTKQRLVYFIACVLFFFVIYSQFTLVARSTGEIGGSLSEIPHSSSLKINRQFEDFIHLNPVLKNNILISDTSNVVLAKFQSLYTQGIDLYFPSKDFYFNIWDFLSVPSAKAYVGLFKYEQKKQFKTEFMPMGLVLNQFSILDLPDRKATPLIGIRDQTIFNRMQISKLNVKTNIFLIKRPINYLVFISSKLGENYYLPENRKNIAMFQLENDPMFKGQEFSALGRYQLLRVFGSTPKPRLVLELTATVMKQFDAELPSPSIYGASRTIVPMIGRGRGRVISEPIIPKYIQGQQFINLDIGRAVKPFPENKKGLMSLYGQKVRDDWRHLAVFARDISLISEEEYQAITPPSQLEHFPTDLANPNLEFSGIYEDGWISERSFFILRPKAGSKFLLIKGSIPLFETSSFSGKIKQIKNRLTGGVKRVANTEFNSELSISINGKEIVTRQLTPGTFEIKVPVNLSVNRQRIALFFSNSIHLPGSDARIVGGKIDFIGFTEH